MRIYIVINPLKEVGQRAALISSNLRLEGRIKVLVNDREGALLARRTADRCTAGALDVLEDHGSLGFCLGIGGGLGEVHIDTVVQIFSESCLTSRPRDLEGLLGFGCWREGSVDGLGLLTIAAALLEGEEGKEDAEDGENRKERLANHSHATVTPRSTGLVRRGKDDPTTAADSAIGRTITERAVESDVFRLGVLGSDDLVLHQALDVRTELSRGLVGRGDVGIVLNSERGLDGDTVKPKHERRGLALDCMSEERRHKDEKSVRAKK